jgi:pimeloyl-ACP methyl ester carboxylesterase
VRSPDATIRLRDGRTLAYAERGPADGATVLYFHGCPGSRLDAGRDLDAHCAELGVRLIAPDRPGFGLSSPLPGRTLDDWTGDVAQLCDALELERVTVYGLSAGGRYALVVAAALAERVKRVMIASGAGPPDPAFFEGMGGDVQILYKVVTRAPWLARLAFRQTRRKAVRDPAAFRTGMRKDCSPADLRAIDHPETAAMLRETFLEATRQGPRAVVEDLRLISGPWAADVAGIAAPVDIWHGEDDRMVPPAHGERLAALIPHATLHRCPGEGHFLAFERTREILAAASPAAT